MKIQQNSSHNPSFGLKLKINSHTAYSKGKKMISHIEEKALIEYAKTKGLESDVANFTIGSNLINKVGTSGDFREGYVLTGNAIIDGEPRKINLTQSWLHSEDSLENHKPGALIRGFIDSIIIKPKTVKK